MLVVASGHTTGELEPNFSKRNSNFPKGNSYRNFLIGHIVQAKNMVFLLRNRPEHSKNFFFQLKNTLFSIGMKSRALFTNMQQVHELSNNLSCLSLLILTGISNFLISLNSGLISA